MHKFEYTPVNPNGFAFEWPSSLFTWPIRTAQPVREYLQPRPVSREELDALRREVKRLCETIEKQNENSEE